MRRALLTLGGTVAGIAALVAFKFQPVAGSAAAAAGLSGVGASLSTTGGAGTAAGTGSAPASTAPTTAPAVKPPATGRRAATAAPKPSRSTAGTGQSTAARKVIGAVANTQYGPMQVEITVSGKKITNVTVLQETNAGGPTSSIDAMAIPQLTQEALAAQSANINAVSGASYTSAGYKQSLQSAIDQAGL